MAKHTLPEERHERAAGTSTPVTSRDKALGLARIVSVQGMPVILGTDAKKQWAAGPDSGLRAGEGLSGGEVDRALVRWSDASEVATSYSTAVKVLPYDGGDSARLKLDKGQLWVWAPGDGQGVKIETPAGVAEIKRGEAIVSTGLSGEAGAPDTSTLVAAFSGQSAFLTRMKKIIVAPGQGVRAWGEGRADAPRPIAAPEALRRGLLWGSEYRIWRTWGPRVEEVLSLLAAPRAVLGIRLEPLPAPDGGLVVYRVGADSPAAAAGLQPGDVLRALNDQPLRAPSDLPAWELLAAEQCPASAAVRRGQELLTLRLDCSPQPPALPWPRRAAPLLKASVISLGAGDLASAKLKLRQAGNRDPKCAAAYYNLGLIFEHENRWPEAVAAYHRAAELAPLSSLVHQAQGRALMAIANLEAAARELHLAVELDGSNVSARYRLGRLLLVSGDPDGATLVAQELLTRPDGATTGERLLADIAAIGRQHQAAVAHCRTALQADAYDLEAKTLLALELDAAGDHVEAEREARELLTWDPTSFRATSLIGAIHLRARDYATAAEWVQRARTIRPDLPDAYSNLGGLYLCMRDYAQAEACYREALRISGGIPAAHIGLAMLLRDTERPLEAEQQYQLALDLDPSNGQALTDLVALCRATGREKRAAMLLTRYDLPRS